MSALRAYCWKWDGDQHSESVMSVQSREDPDIVYSFNSREVQNSLLYAPNDHWGHHNLLLGLHLVSLIGHYLTKIYYVTWLKTSNGFLQIYQLNPVRDIALCVMYHEEKLE